MTKKTSLLIDVTIGMSLTLALAWSGYRQAPFAQNLSLTTYDWLYRFRPAAPKVDQIHIVEIDEDAVNRLGRWPWPRALTAQLVDDVVASGAQVIGLNVLFSEVDQNSGLEEFSSFQKQFADVIERQKAALARNKKLLRDFQNLLDELDRAKADLDGDASLAESVEQAVNVVLPMYFQLGDALGNVDPLPTYFAAEKFTAASLPFGVSPGNAATLPLESFGKVALAIGHSNLEPDGDGRLRRVAPLMKYGETVYPSFGLEVLREFLKLKPGSMTADASGLHLGKAVVPVDNKGMTYLDFSGPAGSFPHHSAVDVMTNALGDAPFTNKIVLIGLTAPGAGQTFTGPTGESYTGLEIWANHLSNVLNQRFVVRPPWAEKAEWALFALAALIVMVAIPLLRARFAIPLALIVLVGAAGAAGFLLVKQGVWMSPALSVALLVLGFLAIVGRRLMFTERGKELVEAEGVETNKMLGLSFQGQGMLDLAFEKFRRCPVDDAMKELLYNLGLDMERKRQFSKAAAVYEHIATVDSGYKDTAEKIELLKKAGEGAVFGSLGKKGSDSTVVVDGLGQNTTLGRYEVIKELGRGAMGIVYLGKDPKINRQVAIKTLRFEEEMDENQTKQVKDRFFREAESAGNLTHPNIIRIFDAGEDQDVAYIAMELIEGEDLKRYCEKSNLLPQERVISMIAQVASGLDYAHKQGVVHRDIKPGNIMLLKDGSLRITDFGIARIQASSKTATGAVLGTPAYMSPEQVNGKKVDGRADIFSLGVTLYEMLTGEKPFSADSIAALLYRIANVDHPDPREFNPKFPPALIPIVNRALAKDPSQRYQTAGQLADDLTQALTKLSVPAAPAVSKEPVAFTEAAVATLVMPPPPVPEPAPVVVAPPEPIFTEPAPDPISAVMPPISPFLEPPAQTSAPFVPLEPLVAEEPLQPGPDSQGSSDKGAVSATVQMEISPSAQSTIDPESESHFLAELEQAFQISPDSEPAPVEEDLRILSPLPKPTTDEPLADETLTIFPSVDSEKTIVLDDGLPPTPPPTPK